MAHKSKSSVVHLLEKMAVKVEGAFKNPYARDYVVNRITTAISIVPAQPMSLADLSKYGLDLTSLATEPTSITDKVDLSLNLV